MKYQTEYQRNFQKRTPRPVDDYTKPERKLNEVPIKSSSSSSLTPARRRGRSLPESPTRNDNNFAVIGPNEKFSSSQLYRLRQPIKDNARVKKPREYAILGRNEKFQDNTIYPLRKPVWDDSARVPVRRSESENHSCGIQTELQKAPHVTFDAQYGREIVPVRSRIGAQSEYQQQFHWKQPLGDLVSDQMLVEDSKVRDRRSDPVLPLTVIDPSEKILIEKASVAVNTPARVEIIVDKPKHQVSRSVSGPINPIHSKHNQVTEYQSRYKPIPNQKKPPTRKAFEAEQVEERKRKEIVKAERAYSDDEGTGAKMNLGKEFRQKNSQNNLRRWKSEYQTTFKPFWRFDYKNGKWYKDAAADEQGFNPNLFWYKELVSSRQRADEYRANAEADHFNRDHMLQLQTGYGGNKSYLAWDTNNDNDADSVVSIDRDLERQRQRDKQSQRRVDERIQSKIHYHEKQSEKPALHKTDQVAQTDHQVDRIVYIDDPIPKAPSAATKAFVRNLNSSAVQQHMAWDSESLYSQRTASDIDFKSNNVHDVHRKHYVNEEPTIIRKPSSMKQHEHRSSGTHSPLIHERQQINNGYTSPQTHEPINKQNGIIRPSTSLQETRHAAGRSNYDTHAFDKRLPVRPHTSMNDYHSYPGNRSNENRNYQQTDSPASKSSFQAHLNRLDERFGQNYNARNKDDDILSMHSARSLSSSCSLASQTLERAQQNMNKYWGGHVPASIDSPK
ncbi:unnamed protein product [Rotaria socialis]|uniref:Nuclear protein MDM1 n=1 Tax=Rotaria socialis TaxID=392032 RepID=A0A820ZMM7_9BILA|nr:unnamed protein product [Rotaria socialis]CAF4565003.1 unnamed protein product [Rotaria socialis]